MMKILKLAVLLLIGLVTSACSTLDPATSRATEEAQLMKDIQAANAVFMKALEKGDADAITNTYWDDAILMFQATPKIEGRANIRAYWAAAVTGGVKSVDLVTDKVTKLGAHNAAEFGRYTLTIASKDSASPVVVGGKYNVTWEKRTGNWKMLVDTASADK